MTDDARDSEQQRHLQQVFEAVTGTSTFVEEQQTTDSPQHLQARSEPSVSEYVTTVARTDGLSDAIPVPESRSGEE